MTQVCRFASTDREAFGEPAQFLCSHITGKFVEFLLDVSGHFTTEERGSTGNHRSICDKAGQYSSFNMLNISLNTQELQHARVMMARNNILLDC